MWLNVRMVDRFNSLVGKSQTAAESPQVEQDEEDDQRNEPPSDQELHAPGVEYREASMLKEMSASNRLRQDASYWENVDRRGIEKFDRQDFECIDQCFEWVKLEWVKF